MKGKLIDSTWRRMRQIRSVIAAARWQSAHAVRRARGRLLVAGAAALLPALAAAQASPWLTGSNSLVSNFTALALPIAILVVMGIGVFAMAGRMQWGTALAAILGVVIVFGAPQLVTWVRGMFAV